MSWEQYFNKPYSGPIKKYLFEILKEKYEKNEKIIERTISSFDMRSDVEALVELFGDIYQSGYEIAFNQFKEEISKHNYLSNLLPPEEKIQIKSNDKIFKN